MLASNGEVSQRPWRRTAIRWATFLGVAVFAVWLAGPMTVQVGQSNGRPIVEPYPSVVFIRTAVVLIAVGMLGYDALRVLARR